MAIKLTVESFLAGIRQSGLVNEGRLQEAQDALADRARPGDPPPDAEAVAAELVDRGLLTDWQSGKLLQGKFKGFVLGRYRLLRLLGRGEMSTVYLAEHVRMKRRCAIKVLPANKVRDTSYLGRFLREAEAVASLDHPNIVRAYDVDQKEEAGTEIHFLSMEYVEGRDLEQLLSERDKFTPIEAAEYIRQAAEGLAHAHENGLIHRDIKPGNLLVDTNGTVKLLDLGLARFFRAEEEESLTIKHDEKVLGTADYLAPEQAVDSHAVDERADIYSLGCTLFFALTGQPPFTEGTLVQRLLAHQTKTPPPVSRFRDDVPEGLDAILLKMLEKRKEDRYQTTRAVADALAAWLVENADDAWRRKHPAVVAAVVGFDRLAQPTLRKADASSSESAVDAPQPKKRRARRRKRATEPPVAPTRQETLRPPSQAKSQSQQVQAAPTAALPSETVVQRRSEPPEPHPLPPQSQQLAFEPTTSRPQRLKPFLHWLMTRQGLMLLALVLTGVVLVTGIGATLHAVTSPPEAPADPTPDDLGGLQRGSFER